MQFTKPALTFDEKLDKLIARGLRIPDRARARHYLRHINYYRLGAYWLAFEEDHATHRFRPDASFDDVINLYVFDREFRLLLLDAIERIEVSVRTHWCYTMAHRHGPHCHLDCSLFNPKWNYAKHVRTLEREVEKSQETFIRHLRSQYDEALPPIWALVEIMTFGQLSNWYTNTARRQDRNAVAEIYHLDERVLTSLLHNLTTVRNHCAHHARLWNREFTVVPRLPNTGGQSLLDALQQTKDRRIYNTLCLVVDLMDCVNPEHTWRQRLLQLIEDHKIDPTEMGFPADWQERALWHCSGGT